MGPMPGQLMQVPGGYPFDQGRLRNSGSLSPGPIPMQGVVTYPADQRRLSASNVVVISPTGIDSRRLSVTHLLPVNQPQPVVKAQRPPPPPHVPIQAITVVPQQQARPAPIEQPRSVVSHPSIAHWIVPDSSCGVLQFWRDISSSSSVLLLELRTPNPLPDHETLFPKTAAAGARPTLPEARPAGTTSRACSTGVQGPVHGSRRRPRRAQPASPSHRKCRLTVYESRRAPSEAKPASSSERKRRLEP